MTFLSDFLLHKKTLLCVSLGTLFAFASCQTYSEQTREMRVALYQNRNEQALKSIDESSVAKSKSDRVLFLMERGNILYLSGKYLEAAQAWDLAVQKIEELYTVSISKQTSSYLLNETVTDYEGEAHEKVLLPVFSALAYLAAGDASNAIVEARRTTKVLENLARDADGKNVYQRDGFAHYLAGIIFEMKREWDNAIIEYRRALEVTLENRTWAHDIQVESIATSLARLAEKRNRQDLLNRLEKDVPGFTWKKDPKAENSAEIIVVYEAGKVPIKKAEDSFITFGHQIIRISFPAFTNEYYASRAATVFVNGLDSGRTMIAQDIGAVARQALADRKPKYIAKIIARNTAKAVLAHETEKRLGPLAGIAVSLAGAATEVADTRAWNTLPALICVARVSVPVAQKNTVRVVPEFGAPQTFVIDELSPGEMKLIRLRTFD